MNTTAPPKSNQTSAEKAIENLRAALQEDNAVLTEQHRQPEPPAPVVEQAPPKRSDDISFNEIDNLIVSLERPKEQQAPVEHVSHDEPVHSGRTNTASMQQNQSEIKSTLDALDNLLTDVHLSANEPPKQEEYRSHQEEYRPHQEEYRPPQEEYKPPQEEYRPHQEEYRPPQQEYKPPQEEYRPPQQEYRPPQQEYKAPQQDYRPSSSTSSYSASSTSSAPKSGDTCNRCGEAINGERIVAMGKKWHKEHFTCISCNRVISDTYVAANDQPYCEDCHQKKLICGKCGLTITGSHIDAKGKLYHLECVGGDTCAKCGKPVNTGQVSVQAADRIWHTECFACARCSKQLKDTFVRREGEIWCRECYTAELVCDKCGQTLGGQYITTKNKKYHADCFVCSQCRSSLGTDYYDVDGQFQCEKCYNTTIGACETCGKGLTGQYVKCLGKMYHENCFSCKTCNGSLGEEFYNVNGYPHCFNCASK